MEKKHQPATSEEFNRETEEAILRAMAENWPAPTVARDQRSLDRFSGGLLNAKTLANHDAAGTGPDGKLRVGLKVAYPKWSLVGWMIKRLNHDKPRCRTYREKHQ